MTTEPAEVPFFHHSVSDCADSKQIFRFCGKKVTGATSITEKQFKALLSQMNDSHYLRLGGRPVTLN